jgi:hypothetical protein
VKLPADWMSPHLCLLPLQINTLLRLPAKANVPQGDALFIGGACFHQPLVNSISSILLKPLCMSSDDIMKEVINAQSVEQCCMATSDY